MNQNSEPIVLSLDSSQGHLKQIEDMKLAKQPNRSILCITTIGGWATIRRNPDQFLSALSVIKEVNMMLRILKAPAETTENKVRIVVDYAALRHCLEGLIRNPECRPSQPRDMLHAASLPGGQGAVSVVEQLECLGYFSASLIDLLLPNFMRELYLTDEIAAVAIEKGHPEIACMAYGEAFWIDPYLAYQPKPKERFEMAALMAGDAVVPKFDTSAAQLFESLTDTGKLRQLTKIEHGFEIMVSFPIHRGNKIKADSIAIKANLGDEIHKLMLHFVNLQILRAYKNLLDSPDIKFFADLTNQFLITWWTKADRKQRLELDLEAMLQFGLPVSALNEIHPKPPESMAAYAATQTAPISPRMAANILITALQEIKRREEA